jgi:mannose-6-phosphate isomerase
VPAYPVVPTLTRPPWGGTRLGREFGKGEGTIGESWELWRENRLADGRRVGDVADLPVLVKLLHTAELLSVQVHPGDGDARALAGAAHGKAEAWVVLDAEPGARIAYGVNRTMTPAELVLHARTGEIAGDLAWITPRPGDVIHVPPGTIHAIGPGLLLYEVQQPIDLTWRLYDWGRGRELHLAEAASGAITRPQPSWASRQAGDGEIFRGPHFGITRVSRTTERRSRRWSALTVVRGSAVVEGVHVATGGTVLLPPGDARLDIEGEALLAYAATLPAAISPAS